jgi:diguanylate cyclase (GGDEF)-like protein
MLLAPIGGAFALEKRWKQRSKSARTYRHDAMNIETEFGQDALRTATTALEHAAAFGRWWYAPGTRRMVVSETAAAYFEIPLRQACTLDDCLTHVVADDVSRVIACITNSSGPAAKGETQECEFRLISAQRGLRWMRLSVLPHEVGKPVRVRGVITDLTAAKTAAVRERLGFALTQYLIGSRQLGDTIVNVIQLVCKSLGWEWGAYWAMETPSGQTPRLVCKQSWQQTGFNLTAFSNASRAVMMQAGEGLVGQVWATGQAQWVDDISTDTRFIRRHSVEPGTLQSGYIFPVTYVSENGERHCPGVLEFYSCLARQQEAQLPKLSAAIGALIAQTAQRLEHEAIVQRMARIDDLTDLANRSHFYACLNTECENAARSHRPFGLVFIDLDRFKPINDAYGHEAGNAVLREFAQRLQALAVSHCLAGRLGGDEFALLVPDSGAPQLARLADQVLQAARAPIEYAGVSLTISASIGVSRFPENGRTGPELLRSADSAMYRVKQNGRNGCDIFSNSSPDSLAQLRTLVAERLAIENSLRNAIVEGELFLLYQPIVYADSGKLHAVEALVRWRKASGEVISPATFIPIAEQSHLIVEIGQWVIQQACTDLARMRGAGFTDLKVHVNMAASEFTTADLPSRLLALCATHRVPPSCIALELTEGMLMRQPEQVIAVMHQLRAAGIEISLDDFGTGHSSLSMLKTLPINSMKIDRSFVQPLPGNDRDRAMAQTILTLGRHMQLDVIAEGIETPGQLQILRQHGCRLVQGFLLSHPLSLGELIGSKVQRPAAWNAFTGSQQ